MPDNVGTLRSVTLAGVTYDVAADADIEVDFTEYEVEGVATSGIPVFKFTKKLEEASGIPLMIGGNEIEDVRRLAVSTTDIILGFETAHGVSWSSTGRFSMGKWSSAEGRADITLLPVEPWAKF